MNDDLIFEVRPWMVGHRLDVILAKKLAPLARHFWGRAIDAGEVEVDGSPRRRSYRLQDGQRVRVAGAVLERGGAAPWRGEIDVLFEDEHLIALNKPAGLIVHPISALTRGAVTQWLKRRTGGPPYLCHRLDRFTSGILLAARNAEVARRMMDAFMTRAISKIYLALAEGVVEGEEGRIDLPLRKAPESGIRLKMVAEVGGDVSASTSWRVRERFPEATLLELELHTGRQHQIRAHLEALGHPVVEDRLYGERIDFDYFDSSVGNRSAYYDGWHALHAQRLGFRHPVTGCDILVEAPLIGAFRERLDELRRRRGGKRP